MHNNYICGFCKKYNIGYNHRFLIVKYNNLLKIYFIFTTIIEKMFHFSSGTPMFRFASGDGFPGIPGMGFDGFPGFPEGVGAFPGMPPADPAGTHTEYYKRLGLSHEATEREIQKAHKKLRVKLHPDRPGGDTEKFQDVQEAYEVLSNPKLRELYDKYGKDGVAKMGDMAQPPKRKIKPVFVKVDVAVQEVFRRQTKTIRFKRGRITGHRVEESVVKEEVNIPKGVPDEHKIVLRDKGHVMLNPKGDEECGDVVVQVNYEDRLDDMTVEGFELVKPLKVSFRIALLGGYISTTGFSDEGEETTVQVFIPPRLLFQSSSDKHIVSVPGQGLPVGSTGTRGSLCLACTIDLSSLRSVVVSKDLHRLMTEELPQPKGESDVLPSGTDPEDVVKAEPFKEDDAKKRLHWASDFFGTDDDDEFGSMGPMGSMGQRVECHQQ